ncbi:hypothetical protein [Telmatospirillum sp. J64-1]|uniref:hypothetical protein n=1 Tax=Telmatospirillum sp. J64-1 TaxID=2502183 RepID=UPI00115DF079|nr:hypothetical protein [Telmatospirillum sp. J64-1]
MRTLPLLAGVGVIGAGLIGLAALTLTGNDDGDTAMPAFPALAQHQDAVTAIVLGDEGQTLRLTRENGWRLADKAGYPVENEKVEGLLAALAQSRLSETPLQASGSQTSQRVRLETEQGEALADFRIIGWGGVAGQIEPVTAISHADGGVSTITGRLMAGNQAEDWAEPHVVDISRWRIAQAVTAGDPPVEVVQRPDGSGFNLQPESSAVEGEWITQTIAGALERIYFSDALPLEAGAGMEELGEARYTTLDGLRITARLLRDNEKQVWVHLEPQPSPPINQDRESMSLMAQAQVKSPEDVEREIAQVRDRSAGRLLRVSDVTAMVMTVTPGSLDRLSQPTERQTSEEGP